MSEHDEQINELQQRVDQLEGDVQTLVEALYAASRLSTTPPQRQFPTVQPEVHGGDRVRGILDRQGFSEG